MHCAAKVILIIQNIENVNDDPTWEVFVSHLMPNATSRGSCLELSGLKVPVDGQ
jgi:hypothetical protein